VCVCVGGGWRGGEDGAVDFFSCKILPNFDLYKRGFLTYTNGFF
jgi:hypothetical protein